MIMIVFLFMDLLKHWMNRSEEIYSYCLWIWLRNVNLILCTYVYDLAFFGLDSVMKSWSDFWQQLVVCVRNCYSWSGSWLCGLSVFHDFWGIGMNKILLILFCAIHTYFSSIVVNLWYYGSKSESVCWEFYCLSHSIFEGFSGSIRILGY